MNPDAVTSPSPPVTDARLRQIVADIDRDYLMPMSHYRDCASALRELLAAREANAWREIASAPKEGTKLCLWNGEESGDGRFFLDRWIWDEGFDCEPQPTHWMPLPPAPEVKP